MGNRNWAKIAIRDSCVELQMDVGKQRQKLDFQRNEDGTFPALMVSVRDCSKPFYFYVYLQPLV